MHLPLSYIQRPRWAPDGSITVMGVDLKGRQGIYRFDLHAGQATPIVQVGRTQTVVFAHSWLDATRLAVSAQYRRQRPIADFAKRLHRGGACAG